MSENDDLTDEIQNLLAAGRKIEAIKRYREISGAGLAEAKDAVEALEHGGTMPAGQPADATLETEIVSLLGRGEKIKAVKLYRERTGVGLKEAKDAVETISAEHRIIAPSGSGCLGVLIFVGSLIMGLSLVVAADQADEQELKQRYDRFVESLNYKAIAKDYPEAVRKLDSSDPKEIIVGLKTLAATQEPAAIPWIFPLLDSDDSSVRIYAGLAISGIVASHELKRRDLTQPHTVVIKPPRPGDLDLAPLSWVVLKMLRLPDDGNTHSYAANIIGYLKLEDYEISKCYIVEID